MKKNEKYDAYVGIGVEGKNLCIEGSCDDAGQAIALAARLLVNISRQHGNLSNEEIINVLLLTMEPKGIDEETDNEEQ